MLSQIQLAVIKASNLFLTTPFPNNYHELPDSELDACITDNIGEGFENLPLENVYNLIMETAVLLTEFHHSELSKYIQKHPSEDSILHIGVDMASGVDQSVTQTIGSDNNDDNN